MTVSVFIRCYSIVILSALLSTVCSFCFATTLNVPGDYATIQTAINDATTGDEVMVAPGTYVENIDFIGKAITVCSTDPEDDAVVTTTIIDGNDAGSVVTFASGEGNTSVLDGFTITNGSGTDDGFGYIHGGGISCTNNSSPIISHCDVNGNTAGSGAGIGCYVNSSPIITNNIISNNTAKWTGGGIQCDTSSPVIENNIISTNSSNHCGGIGCWNTNANITKNIIKDNIATGQGGGVYCGSNTTSTIADNIIENNQAGESGGGLICIYTSSPIITGNTIKNNQANSNGGGIMCFDDCSPSIINNTITNNTAVNGGGINCYNNASTINNCIINGNTAIEFGGGIYYYSSFSTINNCTFNGNSAGYGGAIYYSSYPDLTSNIICNTIIVFSTAGGGVQSENESAVEIKYCNIFGNIDDDYTGVINQTDSHDNISMDPLFVDIEKEDFHLKSIFGRWDGNEWVTDSENSPCIDKGDPDSDYNLEPVPNGNRINMGAYGGTDKASMSINENSMP